MRLRGSPEQIKQNAVLLILGVNPHGFSRSPWLENERDKNPIRDFECGAKHSNTAFNVLTGTTTRLFFEYNITIIYDDNNKVRD